MRKKQMASVEMLIGLYNNSAIENWLFLDPGTSMSYLSILGDTADFGQVKKTFSTIASA
jgi:hypothetical protein